MEWIKKIELGQADFRWTHTDPGLMIGSCFAEEIGTQMIRHKLPVTVNPFGILYNPASITRLLLYASGRIEWSDHLLTNQQEVWYSWDHHGRISDMHKEHLSAYINNGIRRLRELAPTLRYTVITLGSAKVHRLLSSGRVVANCHKAPASLFSPSRLRTEEIAGLLRAGIEALRSINPAVKIIFTVSPVRHWRDGIIDNNLSKASLLLAVDELCHTVENCSYFPAYELLIDELRDYRFYAEDRFHPSAETISYIYNRWQEWCYDRKTTELAGQITQLHKSLGHRPFHRETAGYTKFRSELVNRLDILMTGHPHIDWSEEQSMLSR